MNGAHDLGGMHGFGKIEREPDEPVFHDEWERRIFAMALAMAQWGKWNINAARFARETMDPLEYLQADYYERRLYGLEHLLIEHGFITRAELEARQAKLESGRGVSDAE